MNELNAMQWLNKVDDALDWVLGPPARETTPPQLTTNGGGDGDDNSGQKKNRADHDVVVRSSTADDVGRARSNSGVIRKSPVIILEDYTCPSTPMAAAVGEFLVLDESPYPSSNNHGKMLENKLLPAASSSVISFDSILCI